MLLYSSWCSSRCTPPLWFVLLSSLRPTYVSKNKDQITEIIKRRTSLVLLSYFTRTSLVHHSYITRPSFVLHSYFTPTSLFPHSYHTRTSLVPHSYHTRTTLVLTRTSFVPHSYLTRTSLVPHSYITRTLLVRRSYFTCISVLPHSFLTRTTLVLHSYLFVPHSYQTRTYSYLIRTTLVPYAYITRTSLVHHSYFTRTSLVFHLYLNRTSSYHTRTHSYLIRTLLVLHSYLTRTTLVLRSYLTRTPCTILVLVLTYMSVKFLICKIHQMIWSQFIFEILPVYRPDVSGTGSTLNTTRLSVTVFLKASTSNDVQPCAHQQMCRTTITHFLSSCYPKDSLNLVSNFSSIDFRKKTNRCRFIWNSFACYLQLSF